MKKIININLSGRVIPIEDSAYEKLQSYIESLRRYFANEEGRDEIINDIESRIAELMNEKVRKGASCITDADVDEIIASMGRPEDFDAETTETSAGPANHGGTNQEYSYSERKPRGRLYRDTSDKFIGGVCSGIASYLNVDPAIVRLLFAIMFFGGFGFLLYLILWIVLPGKDMEGYTGKRLYRNPDDKVIGGVAGGLAAYFNVRASTVRLIFVAPLLLSILLSTVNNFDFDIFPNIIFGSLSSTFVFAYVILWIVLPEARTAYEKMEMRGEKVDVNTIRQNVREGMDNVKDRVKGWSEEVKESAQNVGNRAKEFANTRGKTFAREVNETARNSGRGIGHAIGVLFKVFFLFIAGMIAFGLFLAVMALIFGGVAWWPINNFLWTSKWQQLYAWGTVIFFLAVPLVGFIVWVVRRIIRVRSRRSYLGWTFAFLWLVGWVSAILLAASLSKDLSEYEEGIEDVTISQPANGRMIVVASQPELEYRGRFAWVSDGSDGWDLSSDTLKLSIVNIPTPIKSRDSLYHVKIVRHSYGRSVEDARSRAEKIQYSVTSADSVLDLATGYAIGKESKFRGQEVDIEIYVPAGKKIRFDESIIRKLRSGSFRVKRTYRRRGIVNIEIDDHNPRGYRAGIDYTMGIDGELKDPNGKSVNNDYRYDDEQPTPPSPKEPLKPKETEEDQKNKDKQKSSAIQQGNIKENDEAFAYSPSPVFSLTKTFF